MDDNVRLASQQSQVRDEHVFESARHIDGDGDGGSTALSEESGTGVTAASERVIQEFMASQLQSSSFSPCTSSIS